MFLGQDVLTPPAWQSEVTLLDVMEEFPIREQKDRSIMDLGEATIEDDYSEESFPHDFSEVMSYV